MKKLDSVLSHSTVRRVSASRPFFAFSRPVGKQDGATIVEALGAVAITSMLVMGLTSMVDSSMDDLKGQQAAFHQSQVTRGAERYIKAKYDDLINATNSGAIATVTMAQLKTERVISSNLSNTNNYGQTPCMLVRQNSGKLDALVVTYGGQKIPESYLQMVALQAGLGGGYISESDYQNARGASWSLPTNAYRNVTCGGLAGLDGTAAKDSGRLVSNLFHDGSGDGNADFLYRDAIPGKPDLNRMRTPIRLGDAAQVGAGTNCRVGSVATPGIAVDSATNQLLYCSSAGLWTHAGSTFWKDPVANYAALGGLSSTSSPGDVRMTMDKSRAYVFNGGTWVALAVNQSGDMIVERDVRSRDMIASGRIHSEGTIHARDHISTDKDMHVGVNLYVNRDARITRDLNVGRDVRVDQDAYIGRHARVTDTVYAEGVAASATHGWMATPGIEVGYVAEANWRCNYPSPNGEWIEFPIGTIVRDVRGRLLICQQGNVFLYANGTANP